MKSLSLTVCALVSLVSRAVLANTLVQRQTTTATGDRQCGATMCVSATKNGTTVDYVLESRRGTPGWMAMGFGSGMSGATMFILWANNDGTITLSQRLGQGEFEPPVDPNPAQVATVSQALSATSGTTIKYAFSVPAGAATRQAIIYASSTRNPGSTDAGASLSQHIDRGSLTLDLSKSLQTSNGNDETGSDDDTPQGGNAPSGSGEIPLLPFQRVIVAHAIFSLIGFLLFLPAGALLARFFRTSTPKWFFGHWLIQFYIAGPIILVGFILGIVGVQQAGSLHFNDNHKRWGLVIFILYVVQCSLGAFIHFFKFNSKRRLPQNYLHAIIGLLTIGLALFQVRNGYHEEWPERTGREAIDGAANIIWYIWVVLLPVLYLIGLAFLPRQFRQEASSRAKTNSLENSNMQPRYRD